MEDGRPLARRLFSRLPFVRTSLDEDRPKVTTIKKSPPPSPTAHRRRRKGSLRKTLLTTGHIVASSQSASRLGRASVRTAAAAAAAAAAADNAPREALERYGSSTDEDSDGLTLRPRSTSGTLQAVMRPLSDSAPPAPQPRNRRKSMRTAPPLLAPPALSLPLAASLDEPPLFVQHDYSETEWWGWIILLATWIVFVVGMGSCFGVWSWAWDVGETPYAPPELEDDPTLPIVGYYPALIIMTGVMAWVWVIIAWVGMKYFRHAKVWDGEEY